MTRKYLRIKAKALTMLNDLMISDAFKCKKDCGHLNHLHYKKMIYFSRWVKLFIQNCTEAQCTFNFILKGCNKLVNERLDVTSLLGPFCFQCNPIRKKGFSSKDNADH